MICLALIIFYLNYLRIISLDFLPQNKSCSVSLPAQTSTKKTVDEATLAIPYPVLQNPMVNEWRGSVEGKLVAKDTTSITISDNKGNKITIAVAPENKTKFFSQAALRKGDKNNEVLFEKVTIGSYLVGDFWATNAKTLVGSSFLIMTEEYAKTRTN